MIPALESLFQGSNSTARNAVIGSVALVATGVLLYNLFGKSSSSNGTKLAPAIDEEEARKIMSSILEKLQAAVPKLLHAAENIKQQIASQGQQIEDAQLLKMFLLPHLQSTLAEIQAAVLEQFDVDDDELEEAVSEYVEAGDPELTRITKQIQQIFKHFGAEVEEEAKPKAAPSAASASSSSASAAASSAASTGDDDLDDLLRVLQKISTLTTEKTEEFIETFIANYGPPTSQMLAMQFQHGLMYTSQSVQHEVLADEHMSAPTLETLVEKYKDSEQVLAIFEELQRESGKVMAKYGLMFQ